jgi:predicted ferric reductase
MSKGSGGKASKGSVETTKSEYDLNESSALLASPTTYRASSGVQVPWRDDRHPMLKSVLNIVFGEYIALSPQGPPMLLSLFLGVLFTVVASVGLHMMLIATWFHDPGPYASDSWPGYDQYNFVGLVFFTFLTTLAFTLVYVPITTAARYRRSNAMMAALGGFAILCLVTGIVGVALWGQVILRCAGIFCVGPPGFLKSKQARPSSGLGWLAVLGNSAFFSLVPIGVVLLYQLYSRLYKALDPEICKMVPIPETSHAVAKKPGVLHYIGVFFVFVVLVIIFVSTMFIPDDWEYFTASQIATNARIHQTQNFEDCSSDGNDFTCGELPWAYFITKNWDVSEDLVLKFYPANVFFYTYLFAMLLIFVGLQAVKPGRRFVKREAFVLPYFDARFTIGECFLTAATIVLTVLFSFYWFHDHNYNSSYSTADPNSLGISKSEWFARSAGQVTVLFLSLLLFPASRNSCFHKIFGTSWEASLWAHKALGWGMIIGLLCHMIAWWVKYCEMGIPAAIMSVPNLRPASIDNFTVPLISLASFVLIITTVFLTYEGIRRKYFEVFYYAHIYAAYLIIPTTLWHASAGWEYMLPGVTVWFVDRLMRIYRSGCEVCVSEVKILEGVTEIRFTMPNLTVQAGQYIFVNVPEISLLQWHPFTVSSGVGSPFFSVHIKSMGADTWTGKLYNHVRTCEKKKVPANTCISLAVDGPYGHAIQFDDYERVILVCGGIGVTPCASIFAALKKRRDLGLSFHWMLREESLVEAFTEQLRDPQGPAAFSRAGGVEGGEKVISINDDHSNSKVSYGTNNTVQMTAADFHSRSRVHVYLTQSTDTEKAARLSERFGMDVACGRVMIEDILPDCGPDAARSGGDAVPTLVFVCGPIPLVQAAREAASARSCCFHAETFFL